MGLEALDVVERQYRPPWYWLAVLGVVACIATWLIVANGRSRIQSNDRQFADSQAVRLSKVAIDLDDYFGQAIQLVAAGAQTLSPVHDRASAAHIVAELFRSRRDKDVFGLGAFYERDAAEAGGRLAAIYDEVGPGGRMLENGQTAHDADYTQYHWYRRAAAAAPGDVVFDGPFDEDGKSFISTLQALRRNGKLAGVMAVDILTPRFIALMTAHLQSGDVGWIESSSRSRRLMSTVAMPADLTQYSDMALLLRYTGAYVHLLSDRSPVNAENRRLRWVGIALIAAVWTLAGIAGIGLLRAWAARRATIELQLREARLRRQVATQRLVETELRRAAYTDALTGLPSRTPFLERLAALLTEHSPDAGHGIFFIDLDRFNMVNDTLGHLAGDEMLKAIGLRLRDAVPDESLVARFGGDEFVAVVRLRNGEAGHIADGLLEVLREPVRVNGHTLHSAASIGVVVVSPEYTRPDDVLRDADIAMYQAKRLGRDRYAIFDAAMRNRIAQESELEDALRRAIQRDEFVAYYQPLVDAQTLEVTSFEALVRWARPGHGLVAAGEFIGFAETHGMVAEIDDAMLEAVCRDSVKLAGAFPHAPVAVNVSAAHLTQPGVAEAIRARLVRHGVDPARIKLEVTETAVMSNAVYAQATLQRLRDFGVQNVLDDFGQGQSSLAYLQRLPISGLKIDRSFVEPLGTDPQAAAIAGSIVALAQTLGLFTVAEGVETQEQLEAVRALGVDYAQGYLFAPALELEAALRYSSSTGK